jgi:hypothetical protein
MANDGSPRARAGGRRCGTTVTRVDLLTFLVAAALCSASYCLGIWHNSRGAADSRVLGPSAALVLGAASSSCGGDADETPLDFETHHAAEDAGLSVSASPSATAAASTNARRSLRGAAPGRTWRRGVAWTARVSGDGGLRFAVAGGRPSSLS